MPLPLQRGNTHFSTQSYYQHTLNVNSKFWNLLGWLQAAGNHPLWGQSSQLKPFNANQILCGVENISSLTIITVYLTHCNAKYIIKLVINWTDLIHQRSLKVRWIITKVWWDSTILKVHHNINLMIWFVIYNFLKHNEAQIFTRTSTIVIS